MRAVRDNTSLKIRLLVNKWLQMVPFLVIIHTSQQGVNHASNKLRKPRIPSREARRTTAYRPPVHRHRMQDLYA
jgi:hypothetical protein